MSEAPVEPALVVEVTHRPSISFAMEQLGWPIVEDVRVRNVGEVGVIGARLVLQLVPDLGEPVATELPPLPPGADVALGVRDLPLPPGRLRTLVEAEAAQLAWRVEAAGAVLAQGQGAVSVLAWNQWPGQAAPEALLATFVTPNHPALATVLKRVREGLGAVTGDRALDGYQSRSPARVVEQVRALYGALQELDLTYAGVPASFERTGQKIRLVDRVLADQIGNCLDLTVLFAACLEQMGLNPMLVVVEGHAFPGVWLVEDGFPEGVVNDAARLRTGVGLDQLVFWDSSATVHDPRVPFERARDIAERALHDDARFLWALDLAVVRRDRYRPISIRDERAEAPAGPDLGAPAPAPAEPPRERPAPPPPEPVVARFERWKQRLLDLSLHNRLLAFRPETKSALPLDVPDAARFEDLLSSDAVFELLAEPRRDARDERDEALVAARVDPSAQRALRLADLDRGRVTAPLQAAEMVARAVHLERTARTDFEEGGANTLFVAIGFLRWFESESSELPRLAPLLLVPVAIEVERVSRRARLRRLAEEPLANVSLVEKVRRDFGLDLSAVTALDPDDAGVDVPGLLRAAREAIRRMPRWEVLEDVALGIFSFAKFLLWRDLDENADVLLQNPVVQHIATAQGRPFPNREPAVAPEAVDDVLPAARLPLVVDADSTQTAAVASALRGRTFVLQGPPGTGKSQTITNLVAAALAEGKTVLFVAEKMAALDVVQRRLEQAGLGDFCLELHSHKANKKAVVQSLADTLERGRRLGEIPWEARAREVDAERAQLNAYARALHAPRPLGRTFYQATGRLLALRDLAPEVGLSLARPSATTEDEHRAVAEAVAELATAAAAVEPVALHPWRATAHRAWSATLEQGLRQALDDAIRAHGPLVEARAALAAGLGLAPSDEPDVLAAQIQLARAVADGPLGEAVLDEAWGRVDAEGRELARRWGEANAQRADLLARWKPSLLEAHDLDALGRAFASWARAFFLFALLFLFFPRRRLAPLAVRGLPPSARVADDLATGRRLRDAAPSIEAERAALAQRLAGAWDGADPAGLSGALDRAERYRRAVRRAGAGRTAALVHPDAAPGPRAALGDLARRAADAAAAWEAALVRLVEHAAAPLPEAPDRAVAAARAWREALPAFRPWCLYARAARAVRDLGYGPLVDAHAEGAFDARLLPVAAERAFLEAWTAEVRDGEPALRDFDGPNRHRLVARFRADDRALIKLGPAAAQRRLEERLPRVAAGVAESSEPGIILRESRKKTRHKPVRKLLQEIPNLLPRLKPCLLMSPLSVAQYLPAGGRRFDLVVFDEASQICTHDAIGALARGEQAVVVGDSKQLPPTTFFQRTLDDDALPDDNDFVELDSVLDEAVASGLPQQTLGWHYRSRHEALIDFSNQHYYDGRLHVFPSARGRAGDLGVTWHPVPHGVYDKSRTRTNRAEAEALVAHLVGDLRQTAPGSRTFGVVTFSQAQQTLVADLLDEARRVHPEIEPHFAGDEAVFVKNLENVQGDERDEILFTVGYGRDESGRLHMNFGPLNRDGGERRLNVAVTRARRKLRVFSTLTHDQIDLTRTRARGARHLKEFLRYAAERGSERPFRSASPADDFDSDFERQVHDALVANGWRVDGQVGCGAYRIDLAVVHPDRPEEYLLGIECDGAPYHSAASARDRDRLRQQVLEGLGWRLHRVWSTDWWFEREREVARLEEALAQALATPREGPPVAVVPEPVAVPLAAPLVEAPRTAPVVPYVRARLAPISADPEQLHAVASQGRAVEAVKRVLEVEAPLHVDDLAARLGAAFGGPSITKRVCRRVEQLLAKVSPRPVERDGFVWRADQDPAAFTAIRGSYPDGVGRDAESIPPEEIAAAAAWVLEGNHALSEDDLLRETARLFGIARLGAKVRGAMAAGVEVLVRRGKAAREGDRVAWR